ncbi:MAG: hypothetical protein ACXW3X_07470, partial [Rhodoplanes sp.]
MAMAPKRSPHPLTLLTPEGGNNRAQGSKNKGIAEASLQSIGLALHSYMACQHRCLSGCNHDVLAGGSPDSGDLRAAECEQQRPRFLSRVLY